MRKLLLGSVLLLLGIAFSSCEKKDDPAMYEGEQVRALRTVKLYLDNLKSES